MVDTSCVLLGTQHDCNDVVNAFLACVYVCFVQSIVEALLNAF